MTAIAQPLLIQHSDDPSAATATVFTIKHVYGDQLETRRPR